MISIMGIVRNKVMPSRAQELYAGMAQCRISTHILNIMPDGKIYPCPDPTYLPGMSQGDVVANWLRRSPLQPDPGMPCKGCVAFAYCRRNCMKNLYLAYVKGDEATAAAWSSRFAAWSGSWARRSTATIRSTSSVARPSRSAVVWPTARFTSTWKSCLDLRGLCSGRAGTPVHAVKFEYLQ